MKLLTLARDLQRRKSRERHQLFVAEGARTVEELLRSPLEARGVLIGPQFDDNPRGRAIRHELERRGVALEQVSERDFQSAAETDSPQGILAIGVVPERSLDDLSTGERALLLVLDGVQDPGNVGTILRTAAALGASATLALPGTVDLWNAKVVRSGMGSQFHHPCMSVTWDELDTFRAARGVKVWAADAKGEPLHSPERPAEGGLALVVGNEGAGLSSAARTRADRLVSLPIGHAIESLNVAVAAGILLYGLRR
jgi:RNA methyltransferase, TrmH family